MLKYEVDRSIHFWIIIEQLPKNNIFSCTFWTCYFKRGESFFYNGKKTFR